MSALQRKWAKAKLDAMADLREQDEDGAAETGYVPELPDILDDDSSSASSLSSTGTIVPSPSRSLFARPQGVASGKTLDQIPWTTYFERELFLTPEDNGDSSGSPTITYHAYLTSPSGKGPLFVTHHGAGSSGLSFAVLSSEIRKRLPNAGILSLDARGHGSTVIGPASNSDPTDGVESKVDLSLTTLTSDLISVIEMTKTQMKWTELPSIVLVGHSLGGAVVTEVAKSGRLGSALLAYAVLDVVEGSAIDALQDMRAYLSTRPTGFATLREAVEWHVKSRTIRNSVSARTSVPGLLVKEEDEDGEGQGTSEVSGQKGSSKRRPWRWRTDLAATEPFWGDWFVGLSKKFLEAKGGKMLLLAGTDRLDTALTIGQMQGKYALQVFPEAGHFIHEDLPEKTAMALVDFYRRNDRSSMILPLKVSELLAQGKRV